MNYSSRFFLYAPLGLFLAVAFGVAIHWWLAASAFRADLAAMNGHEIAPGVTMRFASRTHRRVSVQPGHGVPDFSLRSRRRTARPNGSTEDFAMHALTYGRDETIFEAAGTQELRWTRTMAPSVR